MKRIFRLAGVRRVNADVDAELSFHFEMTMRELVAKGMSEDEARRELERRFGDVDATRSRLRRIDQQHDRQQRRADWWDAFVHDVRFAARSLRKSPGFTATVVVTLALGIGANAVMFGLVDQLLLRGPAHVVDPSSVQRVYATIDFPGMGTHTFASMPYVDYTVVRDQTRSFTGAAAYTGSDEVTLGRGATAARVKASWVSSDFFALLGVHPASGRFFQKDEDTPPRGANVVVLDEGFWRRQFGADPMIVGKSIVLDNELFTVVGLAPSGFTGVDRERVDVWMPISVRGPLQGKDWATARNSQWLRIAVRLAPGVTARQATEDATRAYRAAYNGKLKWYADARYSVLPISFTMSGQVTRESIVAKWLVGVSLIVLLVACANVANLLLVRAVLRQREIGVRLALGIGRSRLVRLLLSEALLLSLAGAAAALLLANAGGRIMRAALAPEMAWSTSPLDASVLLFTGSVSLLVGLLVGLAPVVQTRGLSVSGSLKGGARDGAPRSRLRSALTVAQASLSVVLLVGAGLFVRSLVHIRSLDLGVQPDRIVVADVDWPSLGGLDSALRAQTRERHLAVFEQAVERVRRVRGVEHASVAVGSPFGYAFAIDLRVPGGDSIPDLPGGGPYVSAVSADHFATMGTRVVQGRAFDSRDREGTERVVIVNETMAKTLWPGRSAIGQCLLIGEKASTCSSVVGVMQDSRRNHLREDASMQYFIPLGQEREHGFGGRLLFVRAGAGTDPAQLIQAVRRVLQELSPDALYVSANVMQESLDPQIRPWRIGASIFGLFGLLALAMAAIGLYSVIAYGVSQRTHELGVRLALGAQAKGIIYMVLRQGVGTTMIGLTAGVALSLLGGRWIASLLFETSPYDLPVFGTVVIVLLTVAVVASSVPAWRAARTDPLEALKSD